MRQQVPGRGAGSSATRGARRSTGVAPAGITIDELAARTGVASRTIRFYQAQGALPPPDRAGRSALYGDTHVERLRLIALLQARGLRLSAIRDLLAQASPESMSLGSWLGLEKRLTAPWSEDAEQLLTDEDLAAMVEGHGAAITDELERVGTIVRVETPDGQQWRAPSAALLRVTLSLDAAGIDVATASGAGDILRHNLQRATRELVEHFAASAGRGFGRRMEPDALAAAVEAVRPLGAEALRVIYAQEVGRELARLIHAPVADESSAAGDEAVRSRRRVKRRL